MMLNVGSGQRPFAAPFINVDCQAKWNPDFIADGAQMPMFENETAEVIALHHVLEHFGCGESDALLKECFRVLKPGGSLLVFVPDMRALCQRWLTRQMDDQLFFTNVYGAYMGDEADRHKWGFTYESVSKMFALQECWSKIKKFDWRKIPGADIAGPDWWILAVEVIK